MKVLNAMNDMKQVIAPKILIVLIALLLMITVQSGIIIAQDTIPARLKVDLKIKYTKVDNLTRTMTISLKRKEGNDMVPVKWAIVNLYMNEITKLGMLGNITTDKNGEGVIPLDSKFKYITDSLGGIRVYYFMASLQNNPEIETTITALEITEAELSLNLYEEGTIRKVKAILQTVDSTGAMKPVAGSNLFFIVKRDSTSEPLLQHPIRTDAKGEVIFDFPAAVEGDSENLLTVAVLTDETDKYGVLLTQKVINWGTPAHLLPVNLSRPFGDAFLNNGTYLIPAVIFIVGITVAAFYYFMKMKQKK